MPTQARKAKKSKTSTKAKPAPAKKKAGPKTRSSVARKAKLAPKMACKSGRAGSLFDCCCC